MSYEEVTTTPEQQPDWYPGQDQEETLWDKIVSEVAACVTPQLTLDQ